MSILFARFFLIVTGLIYMGLGVAFLFALSSILPKLPFTVNTPAGLTEIRALYGGLELALGIIFLYAGVFNRSLDFAVLTMLITFLGLAVTRGVSILIEGSYDTFTLQLWSIETVGVIYSLASLILLITYSQNESIT